VYSILTQEQQQWSQFLLILKPISEIVTKNLHCLWISCYLKPDQGTRTLHDNYDKCKPAWYWDNASKTGSLPSADISSAVLRYALAAVASVLPAAPRAPAPCYEPPLPAHAHGTAGAAQTQRHAGAGARQSLGTDSAAPLPEHAFAPKPEPCCNTHSVS